MKMDPETEKRLHEMGLKGDFQKESDKISYAYAEKQ